MDIKENFISSLKDFINKYDSYYLNEFREVNYTLLNGQPKTEYLIDIKFSQYNCEFSNNLNKFIYKDEFFIQNKDLFTIREEYIMPEYNGREPDNGVFEQVVPQIIVYSILLVILYFLIF